MIFGNGFAENEVKSKKDMKNKTCTFRIMPTKVLGFSKV